MAEVLVREFWDSGGVGFYFTAAGHESLITRPKDLYDNATPSGNSMATSALLRLAKFTGDDRWAEYSRRVLKSLATSMAQHSSAFAHLLSALDFHLGRAKEIAVVGDPQSQQTKKLLRNIFQRYLPNKVVACGLNGDLFLLEGRSQVDGAPTVYVCENYVCQAPVTTAEELAAALAQTSDLRPQTSDREDV